MGYIGNRPTAVPLTSADIQDGVITAADLGANSVDSSELVDGSIDTSHLADNQVTLAKMAGLARGKLIYGDASGDPAALDVGGADEVLTHDGTDFDWAAAGGGGITAASQWRITTSYAGEADPIITYWEEADAPVGFGVLGSSMTESSGRFTFPSTGYWYIIFKVNIAIDNPDSARYGRGQIYTTIDDSTYALAAQGLQGVENWLSSTGYSVLSADYIFDVTSTANCKCSFTFDHGGNTDVINVGNSDQNTTNVTFIRLGDT